MKRLTLLLLLLLLLTTEADVLRCPECGYENKADYKHCINCSQALPCEWKLSGVLCFPIRDDNTWSLAILDLEDENAAPIVIYSDGGETAHPRWRGNSLYFASDNSGQWGVYQLCDGVVTQLDNGSTSVFSPAPGNDNIAIISSWDVCLLSETGGLLPLTTTSAWESEAAWSPDGRWLVWVEEMRLQLFDSNTGRQRQLVSGNTLDSSPVWSPDGGLLYFLRDQQTVCRLDLSNDAVEVVAEGLTVYKQMPALRNMTISSLTDCNLSGNGDLEGYGIFVNRGVLSAQGCLITDNSTDGINILIGTVNLGTDDALGRNTFANNGNKDINSLVVVSARGNEFGTIDGLELDHRVSDSVELSPVVFGGTVNRGSELPTFDPDDELLPVCYVDRDVYLVDDLVVEPAIVSFGPGGGEVVKYFEFRVAAGTKFHIAPQEETPFITPDDPCLVDIEITDIPFIVESCPEGEVAFTTFKIAAFGEFSPLEKDVTMGYIKHLFGDDKSKGLDTDYYLELNDVVISSCLGVIIDLPTSREAHLNNVTVQNGASGIEIISGDIQFRECTIRDNDSFGLSLKGGARAKLYRCEVSGNDGDGIYLDTGAEIDLGSPVGGSEPMVGLNYFADNTGSAVAAHGNQWSESDWELILSDAIHNPDGMDYHHLFPLAWSGVLKSGENLTKCV